MDRITDEIREALERSKEAQVDVARELSRIMDEHPMLTNFGFGVFEETKDTAADRRYKLEKGRDELAGDIDRVEATVNWLEQHMKAIRSINTKHSSYGLKHIAERDIGYITNGVFIGACLILEFPMRADPPNAYFGISERSIRAAAK